MQLHYLDFISRPLHISVTAVPIIRSTILQLAVTGMIYVHTLDREMYGSNHFKSCPELMVFTSLWLSWNSNSTTVM
jgi:hypothetical protein